MLNVSIQLNHRAFPKRVKPFYGVKAYKRPCFPDKIDKDRSSLIHKRLRQTKMDNGALKIRPVAVTEAKLGKGNCHKPRSDETQIRRGTKTKSRINSASTRDRTRTCRGTDSLRTFEARRGLSLTMRTVKLMFVGCFGFLTSSLATRLYRGRVPRLMSENFTCCHTRDWASRPD